MILSIFASAFNLQIQGRRRVREKKLLHKREDRTNKQFVLLGEAYRVNKFTYKLEINLFSKPAIYTVNPREEDWFLLTDDLM